MYRWLDHTAELELLVEADDERSVFAEAVAALGELLDGEQDGSAVEPQHDDAPGRERRPEQRRPIGVDAPDRAALLAECLMEVVFLAETDDLVPLRLDGIALSPARLEATLVARAGSPRHLVKAVTYHGLEFTRREAGWRARVVLDV
jgi:SHS2 domain-containing protein